MSFTHVEKSACASKTQGQKQARNPSLQQENVMIEFCLFSELRPTNINSLAGILLVSRSPDIMISTVHGKYAAQCQCWPMFLGTVTSQNACPSGCHFPLPRQGHSTGTDDALLQAGWKSCCTVQSLDACETRQAEYLAVIASSIFWSPCALAIAYATTTRNRISELPFATGRQSQTYDNRILTN